MLILAITIGIYSYLILFLGLAEKLTFFPVFLATLLFFCFLIPYVLRVIKRVYRRAKRNNLKRIEKLLLVLIILLGIVNFVGSLGPELAFDALWYHLTIPKLFILNSKIYFIEGDLFYYSLMPKLTEMLYVSALILGNEIAAKIIHFMFGLLSCIALFLLAREFVSRKWAIVAVLIFYSNLVVGWLSITAYIDLARAFFETLALYYFIHYLKTLHLKKLIFCSILIGLAISTKIVSLISLPIIIVLILTLSTPDLKKRVMHSSLFLLVSLFVASPWFVISYIYTQNPVYPLFSNFAPQTLTYHDLEPFAVLNNLITVFLFSPDPINPSYIIFLPLVILMRKNLKKIKGLFLYSILTLISWYAVTFLGIWHATDQAGSARFLMPYLAVFSIVCTVAIAEQKNKALVTISIITVLFISIVSIFYRGLANSWYLPVIVGLQTKEEFLLKNLNFDFGDFYDEKQEIKKIVGGEMVLLVNMHNLYYADFEYTLSHKDPAWGKKYILVQKSDLPNQFKSAKPIYRNARTNVTLYKL